MIGPISGPSAISDFIRTTPDRSRETANGHVQGTGAVGGVADATRDGAALDEARTNRSAIVNQAEALLAELRSAAQSSDRRLRIEKNEDTGEFIYKSIDRKTGEVVKEWPPEEVRRSMEFLDKLEGAMLDRSI